VFEQRAENHLKFDRCEVGSQAEVLADAERQVRTGIAVILNLNGPPKTSSSLLAEG